MPDDDIVENMGIGIRVAILVCMIGIVIIPCIFESFGLELMPRPDARQTTLLFSDGMSGTPAFIVAAHDSSALSKSRADYICDGIHDQDELNAAFNELTLGGDVILSEGTFNLDTPIYPKRGITLRGQGDMKTFLEFTGLGNLMVDKENVTLEKFHISGSNHSKGLLWMGLITIRAGHCTVRDITGTCDNSIQAVFQILSDKRSGYNKIIEDVEFNRCKAIDCAGFGFEHNSWYREYNLIRNVRYTECQAINCGRYDRTNPWVTGFDFAEGNDMDNLRVKGCLAEGCWESGFHFEYKPMTTDAILTDCIARNNGQKPYPSAKTIEFLAGFNVGMGDVTLVNCHAEGNSLYGFLGDDASGMKMYGCTDKNTAIGRSDFSIFKPASFFFKNTYPNNPVVMEDCSSKDSYGRALATGPDPINPYWYTTLRADNFVVANAAGVDGTAIQLNHIGPGSVFDIYASGNQASTLIAVNGAQDVNFTGRIVSDVAQPFVVDGSGTSNVMINNFEIVSNMHSAESTGITVTENVPVGAVEMVNCRVISPMSFFGFFSEWE